MNVSLPTPLAKFVRNKVAKGEFSSADEVVCEGLRLLQRRETEKSDIRSKIDVGWAEAKNGNLRTPGELKRNLNSRKRAWQRQRG